MITDSQRKRAQQGLDNLLAAHGQDCAQLARAIGVRADLVRKWKSRGLVSRTGYMQINLKLGIYWATMVRPDFVKDEL